MPITDLPEWSREGEDQCDLRPEVLKDLERIKWYMWLAICIVLTTPL
jgi:hypothetical protein